MYKISGTFEMSISSEIGANQVGFKGFSTRSI